jgi:hypothetical protein
LCLLDPWEQAVGLTGRIDANDPHPTFGRLGSVLVGLDLISLVLDPMNRRYVDAIALRQFPADHPKKWPEARICPEIDIARMDRNKTVLPLFLNAKILITKPE